MKHEYEATFLSVDVTDLRDELVALGAVRRSPHPAHPADLRRATSSAADRSGSGCATKEPAPP